MNVNDEISTVADMIRKVENPFTLEGYTLLGGRRIDGIKYHWSKDSKK